MNSASKIFKRAGLIVVLIIVISVIIWAFWRQNRIGNTQYVNDKAGISLVYPDKFTMVTVPSQEPAALFYLNAPNSQIVFASFVQDADYVERDRRFYNSVLFKDPGQMVNSKVIIGDYFGYKAIIDASTYRYTLYRKLNASSSLIIRSELVASSSPEISVLEQDFLKLISGITVKSSNVDK